MRLLTVTLTGADESVSPRDLVSLWAWYPFVEWGILFSPSSQGQKPRYPSIAWIDSLVEAARKRQHLSHVSFAAHLCGQTAAQVFAGDDTWFKQAEEWRIFGRVQLNGYSQNLDAPGLESIIRDYPDFSYILQCQTEEAVAKGADLAKKWSNVELVWDASGGRGVAPDSWPKKPPSVHMGYAGGIGPDNVESVLTELSQRRSSPHDLYWIDMETKIRSIDDKQFDLAKCEQVLKTAERFPRTD